MKNMMVHFQSRDFYVGNQHSASFWWTPIKNFTYVIHGQGRCIWVWMAEPPQVHATLWSLGSSIWRFVQPPLAASQISFLVEPGGYSHSEAAHWSWVSAVWGSNFFDRTDFFEAMPDTPESIVVNLIQMGAPKALGIDVKQYLQYIQWWLGFKFWTSRPLAPSFHSILADSHRHRALG